ncbi:hypothetical protein [Glycomyces sp. MUSA5-2]|uniref:hypothetical protein n=1 Tax=Glycomyces sp. MUSA5-2 TaxID=2053002 RepID=UPI003008374D
MQRLMEEWSKPEAIESAKRTMRRHFPDTETGKCRGCEFDGVRNVDFPCVHYKIAQVIAEGPQRPNW